MEGHYRRSITGMCRPVRTILLDRRVECKERVDQMLLNYWETKMFPSRLYRYRMPKSATAFINNSTRVLRRWDSNRARRPSKMPYGATTAG